MAIELGLRCSALRAEDTVASEEDEEEEDEEDLIFPAGADPGRASLRKFSGGNCLLSLAGSMSAKGAGRAADFGFELFVSSWKAGAVAAGTVAVGD